MSPSTATIPTATETNNASMALAPYKPANSTTKNGAWTRFSQWIRSYSEDASRKAEARLLSLVPGFKPTHPDDVLVVEKHSSRKGVTTVEFIRRSHTNTTDAATTDGISAHVEFVDIGNNEYINTLTVDGPEKLGDDGRPEPRRVLVLAHGYGAGLGYFYRNYKDLAQPGWRIYAIDWLGMGRSARVKFPLRRRDQSMLDYIDTAEHFFVDSLERWRQALNIERMTLAGHSLGGYMSVIYALKYPERVNRLVLISPVGIPERPSDDEIADTQDNQIELTPVTAQADATDGQTDKKRRAKKAKPPRPHEFRQDFGPPRKIPGWVHTIWDRNYTPQWFVRASGPLGSRLTRAYVNRRMAYLPSHERKLLHDYVYQITTAPGSGEYALSAILTAGSYARRPLHDRLPQLTMPTTFIYGDIDWMDYRHAEDVQPHMRVESQVIRIPNAGHNMFLENPEAFSKAIQAEMQKVV
jgi:cardiolipin-specific phospholipase